MKRYSAAELRKNMARALDEVERGEDVVVERRGARFKIVADRRRPKWPRVEPYFDILDPALIENDWGWIYEPGKGLVFDPGPKLPPLKRRR